MAEEEATLESQFSQFAKMMESERTGNTITLSHSDYWMRQAKILDDRKLTMIDTGNTFFSKFKLKMQQMKMKQQKWIDGCKTELNYKEWLDYLKDVCDKKGLDLEEIKSLLTNCGPPGDGGARAQPPQYRDYFDNHTPKNTSATKIN